MKNFLKRFFEFVKGNGDIEYASIAVGNDFSDGFEELVKKNRNLLSDHGINLNKIRFVYVPVFSYDTDKNIINPNFVVMLPSKKNAPIIEIGKPSNVVKVSINSHSVMDNYEFIKHLVKKTKKGIVIYIKKMDNAIDFEGNSFSYEYSVDGDVLKLVDLDTVGIEIIEDCD